LELFSLSKCILITGASSGIGKSLAFEAASRGYKPILVARSFEKLQLISCEINSKFGVSAACYHLDVSDVKAVSEIFKIIVNDHEKVDVLVNNAGYGIFDYLDESSLTDIKGMIDVNVVGLIACSKEIIPHFIRNGRGHIINVASIAGKLATPKASVYAATKHAVIGFTNALRLELSDKNIFVTAVNPGPIRTNFFSIADKEGMYAKSMERMMLDPDDVAKEIINCIEKPRRELNLPFWMGWGAKLYQLSPALFEKLAGRSLKRK
jgi:short-subunit dehydrogenase